MKKLFILFVLFVCWTVNSFAEIELVWQSETPGVFIKSLTEEEISTGNIQPYAEVTATSIIFYDPDGTTSHTLPIPVQETNPESWDSQVSTLVEISPGGSIVRIFGYDVEGFLAHQTFFDAASGKALFKNAELYTFFSPVTDDLVLGQTSNGVFGEPSTLYFLDRSGNMMGEPYVFSDQISFYSGTAFSESGKYVVIHHQGKLVMFDRQAKVIWEKNQGNLSVEHVQISKNDQYILATGCTPGTDPTVPPEERGYIFCFDITGNLLWSQRGYCQETHVQFSYDAQHVVKWDNQEFCLVVLDIQTGSEQFSICENTTRPEGHYRSFKVPRILSIPPHQILVFVEDAELSVLVFDLVNHDVETREMSFAITSTTSIAPRFWWDTILRCIVLQSFGSKNKTSIIHFE